MSGIGQVARNLLRRGEVPPSAEREAGVDGHRAMLLAAAFAVAWVFLEEVVGVRAQGHYPLMQVVWCRYAAHLVTLLALWGWRQPNLLWRTRRPVYQLARSLLMLVMPLSFVLAVQSGTPSGTVWAVFWLSPLLILGLARWMLGECASWWQWLAAALGGVAAVAMLLPAQTIPATALLMPIAMALSFSVYVVMTRSLRSEPVQANLFYTALGVFLVLTPFMPGVWVTPSPADTLVLIAIGVLGLVSLLALDRSAAHAPVTSTAPVLYIHLLCQAALAVLLGGGLPAPRVIGGGLLITAILWYLWVREPARSVAVAASQAASRERTS